MYTVSDMVEIGAAQDVILNMVKQITQSDDDDFMTLVAEEFDE